jgi:hypothetical protein
MLRHVLPKSAILSALDATLFSDRHLECALMPKCDLNAIGYRIAALHDTGRLSNVELRRKLVCRDRNACGALND